MKSPLASSNPHASALPFPLPGLTNDRDVGPELPGHLDRVVGGAAVDQNHLVEVTRQTRKHVGEIERLVLRRNHN